MLDDAWRAGHEDGWNRAVVPTERMPLPTGLAATYRY